MAPGNGLAGADLYHLACVFALAAAKADDTRSQEAHADRAVEWLNRARAAGSFKAPARRERLAKDRNLDALRPQANFQKLLGERNNSAQPGK